MIINMEPFKMIKRVAYPIGQGTFYSETHFLDDKKLTIVYDCGSTTSVDILKQEIRTSGIQEIDVLVLSHFHKDHFNGFKIIKDLKITVKRLIMPNLDNEDIVLYRYENDDFYSFYSNPQSIFENCKVTKIFFSEEREDDETPVNIETLDERLSHNKRVTMFNEYGFEWVIKFYVAKSIYGQKITPADKETLSKIDMNNFESDKDMIKDIYKKISKDLNLTSMCMYSGPYAIDFWVPRWCDYIFLRKDYILGTMLTGDILLNDENRIYAFVKHYKNFLVFINCFQISHHGSHENMIRVIDEFNLKKAFIQAGEFNKYGHPAYPIVNMHRKNSISTKVITERSKRFYF